MAARPGLMLAVSARAMSRMSIPLAPVHAHTRVEQRLVMARRSSAEAERGRRKPTVLAEVDGLAGQEIRRVEIHRDRSVRSQSGYHRIAARAGARTQRHPT